MTRQENPKFIRRCENVADGNQSSDDGRRGCLVIAFVLLVFSLIAYAMDCGGYHPQPISTPPVQVEAPEMNGTAGY